MKPPNVLLIFTDQQRSDSLGCYGFDAIPTPHLDQLAEEGALFENCYCDNPICTPSRASILTGKPLPGHGVYQVHNNLSEEFSLFPIHLKEKNYNTAIFGKLHVSGRSHEREVRHPNTGFDVFESAMTPFDVTGKLNSYGAWLRKNHPDFHDQLKEQGRNIGNVPEEVHFTHWAAEGTIDFLKSHDKNKPFFCYMSVVDPHDPYGDYPSTMLDQVDKSKLPEPIIHEGQTTSGPAGIQREHYHSYLGGIPNYSPEQIQKMREGYYASIAFIDREVGRVLEVLEKEGLKEDTIVIFGSDHGDMIGDHELLAKGAFFYDACTKVPLIIRYPEKVESGKRVKDLVQLHDIAGTILSQAGFAQEELEDFMPDSMDLISLIKDKVEYQKRRDHAVCIYRTSGIDDRKLYWDPPINATMFRDERYKLNVYHNLPDDNKRLEGELYDMENDPTESKNLWDDPNFSEVKLCLIGRLMDWFVCNDVLYNGARAGDSFPPKAQWSLNNPL